MRGVSLAELVLVLQFGLQFPDPGFRCGGAGVSL